MLLLITGSIDGTSDRLIATLGGKNVFRLNYDLYKDYTLEFTPSGWKISNPIGHSITSEIVSSAFWWKAFNFYLKDEDDFIVEEVKYIFRELYHWCRRKGLTKGNPHDFHNHMGKINLLEIASTHFTIPDTLASFRLGGVNAFPNKPIVAKSFSSGLTTTNKSLMTTEVDKTKLHPEFPWFIQEKITSDADITTFICGDNLFTYERDRKNLKGLDWRSEQSFSPHVREWKKINLTEDQREKIFSFCLAIGVDWGRIDFMRSNSGELIFLEYNANGQWVFLDFQNEDGLLDCVARYIFPQ